MVVAVILGIANLVWVVIVKRSGMVLQDQNHTSYPWYSIVLCSNELVGTSLLWYLTCITLSGADFYYSHQIDVCPVFVYCCLEVQRDPWWSQMNQWPVLNSHPQALSSPPCRWKCLLRHPNFDHMWSLVALAPCRFLCGERFIHDRLVHIDTVVQSRIHTWYEDVLVIITLCSFAWGVRVSGSHDIDFTLVKEK